MTASDDPGLRLSTGDHDGQGDGEPGKPVDDAPAIGQRERLVREVLRGLYDGRYEPGQRLTEAELTRRYGISRGPVREALSRLATMGVIELTLQRSAQVRILKLAEAIDMLVVAEGLLRIAARLAAERIDRPRAAERMTAALERLRRFDPRSEDADYIAARDGFYATLQAVAQNSELSRMLPMIQMHLVRIQFRSILRAVDSGRQNDYERIGQAVLAGRPAAAEAAVRIHLTRAIEALRAQLD